AADCKGSVVEVEDPLLTAMHKNQTGENPRSYGRDGSGALGAHRGNCLLHKHNASKSGGKGNAACTDGRKRCSGSFVILRVLCGFPTTKVTKLHEENHPAK